MMWVVIVKERATGKLVLEEKGWLTRRAAVFRAAYLQYVGYDAEVKEEL